MTLTLFDQLGKLQAGETFGPWELGYTDFPRSGGWSLKCVIIGQTGPEAEATATAGSSVDSFSLTFASTATATIKPGSHSFVIEVTHTTNGTYFPERGAIAILPNPRTVTAEMTILLNIRAVKAGLAVDGQRTTALDGIQLRNMTPAELDSWESKYIKIVNAQVGRAGGNGGIYAIKMRTPQDNRYAAPWYGPYPPPGGR